MNQVPPGSGREAVTVKRRRGDLTGAREFARILDSAFRVPGTRFRFGLDPVLGLLPGIGDVVGGGFAAYLLWVAARAGAPAPVLIRMALNIGADALFGAVPLLGDLLDAGWKANKRNLDLLSRYLDLPDETRSRSWGVLAILLLILLVLLVGSLWLAVAASRALLGWIF